MNKFFVLLLVLFVVMLVLVVYVVGNFDCQLCYNLFGWLLIYKIVFGIGMVICSNGVSMLVCIEVKGGGLIVGKLKIINGCGSFIGVVSVNELLGIYVLVGVYVGVVKFSNVQVMIKGDILLVLFGIGKGWDLGVDGVVFIISWC